MRLACRVVLLVCIAGIAGAQPHWDEETLALAARTPIQEGGRLKPLDTFARFTLLQMSGRSTAFDTEGKRLPRMAWLLDVLFYPARAEQYPIFLIENPEVMDALGLAHADARQRFSYTQLAPARAQLLRFAGEFGRMDQAERSTTQRQLLRLAHNLELFKALTQSLDFARDRLATLDSTAPILRILPPAKGGPEHDTWLSPGELVRVALSNEFPTPDHAAALRALREMEKHTESPAEFRLRLESFQQKVATLAGSPFRPEAMALEVRLYRLAPFDKALALYLMAFLIAAAGWIAPRVKWLHAAALLALAPPLALHVYGIVLRCIIRGRPPVSTLYETILFVAAVAVVVAVTLEIINRRRVALSLAAVLGALGLFLAGRYEAMDGQDTMPALIAVLDTNFWLATHVTTVTIGYAAGLLAGAVSHVYLIGKAFGIRRNDSGFYASLTRMSYGIVCFCLLFATIGTILGGIWANDSWGRFWGWDPKENGALMIVLWGLTILHARLGGYIREFGLHMAAVFLAIIVGFSWFGVNLLGVGLHSYGFTTGVYNALLAFYLVECLVLCVGAVAWFRSPG